jgi:preprotein translocase subunit SecG
MGIIGIVLLVIMVIAAVLLVLVVLVQDDQGEGIGGIFGGGSNTAFGSRSGNVLTRFTAALAAVFLVCCFGLAWINRTPTAGNVVSKARQEALSGTNQQSWWVQTPAPAGTTQTPTTGSSPFGGVAPQGGSATPATPAPATGPAPAPGNGTTPAPGTALTPAPSGTGGQ